MNRSIFKSLVAMILNSIADMLPDDTYMSVFKSEAGSISIKAGDYEYYRSPSGKETLTTTEGFDNE